MKKGYNIAMKSNGKICFLAVAMEKQRYLLLYPVVNLINRII